MIREGQLPNPVIVSFYKRSTTITPSRWPDLEIKIKSCQNSLLHRPHLKKILTVFEEDLIKRDLKPSPSSKIRMILKSKT